MSVLVVAGALLLLVTGAAKLRRPAPTATALLAVLPVRLARRARSAALLLGAAEVVVAVVAVAVPGPVGPALLALTYAGFGAYAARMLATGSAASCGCSGRDDTPVTRLHVLLDAVFAVGGVVAAATGSGLLWTHGPAAVAGLAVAGLGAYAGWLVVAVHPSLAAARAALRTS